MEYAKDWDVVIVGGGPGGNRCAEEFAKLGMKTLVVERKAEIGPPKRCGEGISIRWFGIAGLEYDPTWCMRDINGALVVSPNGKKLIVPMEDPAGYVVERRMFEKRLAERAIRAGAKYMLKAQAYDIIKDGARITGLRVRHEGKELELGCKLLIAADGIDSRIARLAGLKTTLPLGDADAGYQYEMVGLKMQDSHKLTLYFGKEAAPRGYVWIFPKGDDVANVGIGLSGSLGEGAAKHYLDKFIAKHPEIFGDASITEINAGTIPVGAACEKLYADGLLLVGDSGRMVNPIHGGGIGESMEAGIIAAKIGSEAIKAGDVSERRLKAYQDEWHKVRGSHLKGALKVRHFFEKLEDSQIDLLADMVKPEDLLDLAAGKSIVKVATMLLRASPKAAGFVMSFLK